MFLFKIDIEVTRFKNITTGHTIIMGRKTFESLGRVLPNRKHIVLTQNKDYKINDINVEVVYSLTEINKYIESKEEVFVIGGATIYNLLMPYVTKMYITQINKNFEGDAFFPNIDKKKWKIIEQEKHSSTSKNNFSYEYITYEKIIN